MAWRKWFVRSIVFGIVACCAVAGYCYQQWTNPAAVRDQVISKLADLFPGAVLSLDAARLRLLGGIQVQELRFARRGDPDAVEFAHVPSALLYHDKERILEGELSLRKVELHRPRLRAYRNPNGIWNLEGVIGEPELDKTIPTIVIHQGTIILEDRTVAGNVSSLEISEVNLTLINDPLPTLNFQGTAQSALVGKVTVAGTLERATGAVELDVKTVDTPLGAKLMQRVAPWCPKNALKDLDIAGQADLHVHVNRDPDRQPALRYEAVCHVRQTKIKHPLIPMPLEDVCASVCVRDGAVSLSNGSGRSGATLVKASGTSQLPCLDQHFELRCEVQHLPLSDDLMRSLPPKWGALLGNFQPRGNVSVKAALACRDGEWVPFTDGTEPSATLIGEGVSATPRFFPYPLEQINGSIAYDLRSTRAQFDLAGLASKRPVTLRGHTHGTGKTFELALDLSATGIPLDETLFNALDAEPRNVVRSFHWKGAIDLLAKLRHGRGEHDFENEFYIRFANASACWDAFPLAMTQITGRLNVLPHRWELHDIQARHGDAVFRIQGRSLETKAANDSHLREGPSTEGLSTGPVKRGQGVIVQIQGTNLELDDDVRKALAPMPGLQKTWSEFRPGGRLNFGALVNRPTANLDDLEVQVQAEGATLEPKCFAYRFHDLKGAFHYRKNQIEMSQVSARHGAACWTLPDAKVVLRAGGGFHADLPEVDIDHLAVDASFIGALPPGLRKAAAGLDCRGPLRVKTRLVVDSANEAAPRDIYWNGQAWLRDAQLQLGAPVSQVTGVIACRGRHNGQKLLGVEGNLLLDQMVMFRQPFANVQVRYQIKENTPETLLAGCSAALYGGDVTGELRFDFGAEPRFELNLTASQIDVQKFGQQSMGTKSQVEGKAVGRLFLTGTSAGVRSLEGQGSFDILAGKLYNLPLILDLLKFLGLRWPDRTAFEEVHALFRIRGPDVVVRRLDLRGNAITLMGQGEFKLDGTDLDLEFYPTWARIDQLLPPALRDVPPAIAKNLLVIEVRGKVGSSPDDLKFTKKAMPIVVDPLLNLRNRVIGPGERRLVPGDPHAERAPRDDAQTP